jgi:DNA-binding transcriptional LysR family regulator
MFENLFSIGGLSIDRLKSFVEVAEKGAIARVADGDPSRQSLISRQISELEAFFGTELTRRKGKGLELTDAGQELARQVRLQFQGLADFKASCSAKPVEFRIAAGNSVLEWLLASAMADITRAVPDSRFVLLDARTGEAVRGLLDHTMDFGIIRKSAVVQPLKFRPVGRFGYALFVPKALDPRGKILPADLPLALSMGGDFFGSFQRAAGKAGESPNVVYRCTSFTQAAQLVRSGTCGAILPRIAAPFLAREATIHELPWLEPVTRNLGIAWHRRLLDVRPMAGNLLGAMEGAFARALKHS